MSVGTKFDSDKLRYDLLDDDFEAEMVRVLTDGANVHGAYNWREVDEAKRRYFAALRRHLLAWRRGETIDPSHGTSHLAHVAVNAMFLAYFDHIEKKGSAPCNTSERSPNAASAPSATDHASGASGQRPAPASPSLPRRQERPKRRKADLS